MTRDISNYILFMVFLCVCRQLRPEEMPEFRYLSCLRQSSLLFSTAADNTLGPLL